MKRESGRVFVLGLDGATFDIIDALIAKGRLPNLASLIRRGCGGELISTIHPFSAQAWSSFMTGMNPGKHGIVDFTEHVKGEYRLKFLNASHRRGKSLWRILSEHGRRVCVLNVPFTYPPEEVNGFMISGMDAPSTDSEYTYPKELSEEISAHVGEYIIELGVKDYIAKGHPEAFLKEIEDAFKVQMKTLDYLLNQEAWDFFMYVCRFTDQVQHYFWKYYDANHPSYDEYAEDELRNAIASLYESIDELIGRLTETLDEEVNIVVMSDHGHGGINGKKIFLNKWLESQGLLEFEENRRVSSGGLFGLVSKRQKGDFLNFVRSKVPKKWRLRIVRNMPMLKDNFISQEAFSNIDWERTKAYSDEKKGNIWINVRGCQPNGIVNPGEEYEKVREQVIEKVKQMKDPDSQTPIFPEVFKKEELYSGPYLDKAPDIILNEGKSKYSYVFKRSNRSEDQASWIAPLTKGEMDKLPNATHRVEGILIVKGKHLREEGRIFQPANIMDIAPTILYMMGLPVPENMDGKVLIDLFDEEYMTRHQVELLSSEDGEEREGQEYGPDEEEIISERLRQLGYL